MRYFVIFLSFLLISFSSRTLPDKIKSAYIHIEKSEYSTTEKIGFYIHSEEGILIETMSCSCGNNDFYYHLFKKGKKMDTSSFYRRHSEDEMTDKCVCLSGLATLVPSVIYYIEPISDKGIYYLEIKDSKGNVLLSSDFVVK